MVPPSPPANGTRNCRSVPTLGTVGQRYTPGAERRSIAHAIRLGGATAHSNSPGCCRGTAERAGAGTAEPRAFRGDAQLRQAAIRVRQRISTSRSRRLLGSLTAVSRPAAELQPRQRPMQAVDKITEPNDINVVTVGSQANLALRSARSIAVASAWSSAGHAARMWASANDPPSRR